MPENYAGIRSQPQTAPRWKADELRIPSMYDLPTADENFCALHAYEHTVSYFRIAISAKTMLT